MSIRKAPIYVKSGFRDLEAAAALLRDRAAASADAKVAGQVSLSPLQQVVLYLCDITRAQGLFLEQIFAVTCIGPYATPKDQTLLALVQLMAWQLVMVENDAGGRMFAKSTRKGRAVAEATWFVAGGKNFGGGL